MVLDDAGPLVLAESPTEGLSAGKGFPQAVVCGGKLASLQVAGDLCCAALLPQMGREGNGVSFLTGDDASDGRLGDFLAAF